MKIITTKGIISAAGKILLDSSLTINWDEISNENLPKLPMGSKIELAISFDEDEFILGKDGIVWATYYPRQAEIIHNALLAQNIGNQVEQIHFCENDVHLIKIINETDIDESLDFIWRSSTGLRLKPDWKYSGSNRNESFEQWLRER